MQPQSFWCETIPESIIAILFSYLLLTLFSFSPIDNWYFTSFVLMGSWLLYPWWLPAMFLLQNTKLNEKCNHCAIKSVLHSFARQIFWLPPLISQRFNIKWQSSSLCLTQTDYDSFDDLNHSCSVAASTSRRWVRAKIWMRLYRWVVIAALMIWIILSFSQQKYLLQSIQIFRIFVFSTNGNDNGCWVFAFDCRKIRKNILEENRCEKSFLRWRLVSLVAWLVRELKM